MFRNSIFYCSKYSLKDSYRFPLAEETLIPQVLWHSTAVLYTCNSYRVSGRGVVETLPLYHLDLGIRQPNEAPFPVPADAQMEISLSKKFKFWATVHTYLSVFCLDLIVLVLKSMLEETGHGKEEILFNFCGFSIRKLNLTGKTNKQKQNLLFVLPSVTICVSDLKQVCSVVFMQS